MGSSFFDIVNISMMIGILIICVYLYSTYTFKYWTQLGVKSVTPVPFFGNSFHTIFRKVSSAENQQQLYKTFANERYFGIFMFRTPLLIIRDPHLINFILSKHFVHFFDRGINFDERLDLLSSHLVNLRGQRWKSLRSKLTPAFSSGKLKLMSCLML